MNFSRDAAHSPDCPGSLHSSLWLGLPGVRKSSRDLKAPVFRLHHQVHGNGLAIHANLRRLLRT